MFSALLLLLLRAAEDAWATPQTQEFFIGAMEVAWDYAEPAAPSHRYQSVRIQGPTIRAQVNDKIVVHFKNFASHPFSISPIGIPYWKQSEGAGYEDSTDDPEKGDDAVAPGGYYRYVWDVQPHSGPTATDPECLTYSYSSQVDVVRDFNSGLVGALLICKSGGRNPLPGRRKAPEFILLFAVFNENKSWYRTVERTGSKLRKSETSEFHTINGHVNSTLPGLSLCQSYEDISWHLIGLGSSSEIHSIQFEEHTLEVMNHRKVFLEMAPMTFTMALMKPLSVGKFLISCRIHYHQAAAMTARFSVENCPQPAPGPNVRKVKQPADEDSEYEDGDEGGPFSIQVIKPKGSVSILRSPSQKKPKLRVHYIAAEEMSWDYAPDVVKGSRLSTSDYLKKGPDRLGKVYKKVVYVEYTDKTFTKRKPAKSPSVRLMGPVLRAETEDKFQIIFKNLASRPFNIYPNGLTKDLKDLSSLAIQPGQSFVYLWKLTPEDGPAEADPRCLTRLYQSAVDPERDLASGLIGPLIICKRGSLDSTGRVVTSDKEKHLIFAIFDENKSWYIDENIQKYSQDPNKVNKTDPDFYNSNMMYSVNGLMFSNLKFEACTGEVIFWHLATVGAESRFLSVYFTGNPFERDKVYDTVLTLFPMTGETVATEMETIGEVLINDFKSRGMSVRYSVYSCERELSLVDREDYDELSDYIADNVPAVRGARGKNRTLAVRVCRKNHTSTENPTTRRPLCEIKHISVATDEDRDALSEGGIPQDILDELDAEMNGSPSERQRRSVEQELYRSDSEVIAGPKSPSANVDANISKSDPAKSSNSTAYGKKSAKHQTQAPYVKEKKASFFKNIVRTREEGSGDRAQQNRSRRETFNKMKHMMDDRKLLEPLSENDVLKDSSLEADQMQESLDYAYVYPDKFASYPEFIDDPSNSSGNQSGPGGAFSFEDDEYGAGAGNDEAFNPRTTKTKFRVYYIAAEEIVWDYGIKKPEMRLGMRKYLPEYKKVVFRAYQASDFLEPVNRGEINEHLGIMGPVLKAEVNDVLTVVFRNKASRPYSLHLQGIYDKYQGDGSQADEAPGKPVPPGEERVYNWRLSKRQGPSQKDFDCKAGAYYSDLNKEKDINSGLIGPLLICKTGTLDPRIQVQQGVQDFFLLFSVFDERKSWYLRENMDMFCTPPCEARTDDAWFEISNKFSAINGYVAETLPGLAVAQYQTVRWHLLNMGSGGEFHAVHFHGLPFNVRKDQEHRRGIFNLYPGVFGTVEMRPTMLGTWLVECTIGEYQLSGMRAKLLVYNPSRKCVQPLGMQSGRIADNQITASDHYGGWGPSLARLHLSGSINAWIGKSTESWIQVDLLGAMIIHGIQTQGARTSMGLKEIFTLYYTLSYSLDNELWKTYRGNSTKPARIFKGNMDGSKIKENALSPPIIGRYLRVHPVAFQKFPTLRLEFLGCDMNSCSMPMGMQSKVIPNQSITASSFLEKWFLAWTPPLARLHQEGSANAWRPKTNNPHEWIQVDFLAVKRVTGIVTQGARAVLTPMMVTEFSVSTSDNGHSWTSVQEKGIFEGNGEHDQEMVNLFDPPLFARYVRVHPKGWANDIALRLEFLGCDTQQRL
uniref:F5/8 type C domain-containing protein n=1 Tax=Denticeps clupeoides TaxID=299321 RepID=A0AAY4CL10_9TELE